MIFRNLRGPLLWHVGFLIIGMFLLFAAEVRAEIPAAKATGRVGGIQILDAQSLDWSPIMSSSLKTANQKELFMQVALECGLLTRTLVRSKTGVSDTSSAQAGVKVRVLVDGKIVAPGEVVYCHRTQELTAVFGGILQECRDSNGDGVISAEECSFLPEELNLLLRTMNANSFNFILGNVGSGVHTITVETRIDTGGAAQAGSMEARASIGKGSILVQEVRAVRGDAFEF